MKYKNVDEEVILYDALFMYCLTALCPSSMKYTHHLYDDDLRCGPLPYHADWLAVCSIWASYKIRKSAGCACAGNAGNVFPATAGKAIPKCITARA